MYTMFNKSNTEVILGKLFPFMNLEKDLGLEDFSASKKKMKDTWSETSNFENFKDNVLLQLLCYEAHWSTLLEHLPVGLCPPTLYAQNCTVTFLFTQRSLPHSNKSNDDLYTYWGIPHEFPTLINVGWCMYINNNKLIIYKKSGQAE